MKNIAELGIYEIKEGMIVQKDSGALGLIKSFHYVSDLDKAYYLLNISWTIPKGYREQIWTLDTNNGPSWDQLYCEGIFVLG
ncbi:MAG: hypothetical protein WC511_01695 [Candidatus Pacearchaeota archaeon]